MGGMVATSTLVRSSTPASIVSDSRTNSFASSSIVGSFLAVGTLRM
jgi:hypothetical protein